MPPTSFGRSALDRAGGLPVRKPLDQRVAELVDDGTKGLGLELARPGRELGGAVEGGKHFGLAELLAGEAREGVNPVEVAALTVVVDLAHRGTEPQDRLARVLELVDDVLGATWWVHEPGVDGAQTALGGGEGLGHRWVYGLVSAPKPGPECGGRAKKMNSPMSRSMKIAAIARPTAAWLGTGPVTCAGGVAATRRRSVRGGRFPASRTA